MVSNGGKTMKIIVSGPASAYHGRSERITETQLLQALHGLRYDEDVCAKYLDHELLNDVSIVGGAIQIAFDPQRSELRVVSEYWSPAALKPEQLQALADQTYGQWSDGIGEGCFDEWSLQSGINLDLAQGHKQAAAEQAEDDRVVPRFAHLAKAVWKGNLAVVREAVAEKADLNSIYDGHTALCLAILRQDPQTALLLIEGGADVNRASVFGKTSLMACASLKRPADAVAVAAALLAKGANVEARDEEGNTALAGAQNNDRKELAALLMEQGAT
jgi:hypothetical protein